MRGAKAQNKKVYRALWFYPLVSLLGGGTYKNCCLPVLGDWECIARNERRAILKKSLFRIITVTRVWSTGETGDIYPSLHLSTIYKSISPYILCFLFIGQLLILRGPILRSCVLIQAGTELVFSSIFYIGNKKKYCCIVVTCSMFDCFLAFFVT